MMPDYFRRATKLAAAIVILPAFAAPASAQWSSGWADRVNNVLEIRASKDGAASQKFGSSLIHSYGAIAVDQDTAKSLQTYTEAVSMARCVTETRGDSAADALKTMPSSAAANPTFERLFSDAQGCGARKIGQHGLRRGMLSEAVYLSSNPSAPTLPSMPNVERLKAFRASEFERNQSRHEGEQILSDVANCLVMSNLSLADRVARAQHGGEEEEALMEAMFAVAPYCAGEERPKNLGKSFLRAFLMESLYRATLVSSNEEPDG